MQKMRKESDERTQELIGQRDSHKQQTKELRQQHSELEQENSLLKSKSDENEEKLKEQTG